MSEGGRPHRLRWWGGAAFAALCAGAAFIAQVWPGERPSPWASWAIAIGGAAATMVVVLIAARQTWAETRAREGAEELAKTAVANYGLALRSVLIPLTDIIDRIVTAPNEVDRHEAKGAIKQAVVNSVAQLTGISGARSCYFDYERNGKEARLVCRIYAGRDSRPRTEFSSADPDHAEVFRLLEIRESELIENIDIERPPRFPLKKRDYKTYISVPVATSAEIFGLLTLDALEEGKLELRHVKEMLLPAQLLGIALASDGNNRSSVNSIATGRQRRLGQFTR